MNSRQRVRALFNHESTDRTGFWLGHPADETKKIYGRALGIDVANYRDVSENGLLATEIDQADIELASALDSDLFWCSPEIMAGTWKHPQGKPMFDVSAGKARHSLGQAGVFADCTDVREIERFDWPDIKYLDLDPFVEQVRQANKSGMAVVGGMWMSFFHVLCDFFGMENYFIKMYTHPAVVEAATEHLVDFYLQANKKCLDAVGDQIEAVFFGNDLGSQADLLISPDAFNKFILPYFSRIIDQAKSYDLKVMLHSCGSIKKILPALIEIGIDALHPLQAKANGMTAEDIARECHGKVLFVGGVDTQELLPFGTAEQVYDQVMRLKDIFGPGWIVSPSHEALLPNVPIGNVLAMRDAALL